MRQKLAVIEQTFHRWRDPYGGLKVNDAKRLKELERENTQLKKAVADLTLDNDNDAGSDSTIASTGVISLDTGADWKFVDQDHVISGDGVLSADGTDGNPATFDIAES